MWRDRPGGTRNGGVTTSQREKTSILKRISRHLRSTVGVVLCVGFLLGLPGAGGRTQLHRSCECKRAGSATKRSGATMHSWSPIPTNSQVPTLEDWTSHHYWRLPLPALHSRLVLARARPHGQPCQRRVVGVGARPLLLPGCPCCPARAGGASRPAVLPHHPPPPSLCPPASSPPMPPHSSYCPLPCLSRPHLFFSPFD